jgi:stage V sporulation protein S
MTQQQVPVEVLRVSHTSRPSAVAGAIAGVLRERGQVEIQAVGAGAINQAVKAIAVARSYLVEDGINLGVVPYFVDLILGGEERTGLRFLVEDMTREL